MSKSEKTMIDDYSDIEKAEIVDDFFIKRTENNQLDIATFSEMVGIEKSLISSWIQDKDDILRKVPEFSKGIYIIGCLKLFLLTATCQVYLFFHQF